MLERERAATAIAGECPYVHVCTYGRVTERHSNTRCVCVLVCMCVCNYVCAYGRVTERDSAASATPGVCPHMHVCAFIFVCIPV